MTAGQKIELARSAIHQAIYQSEAVHSAAIHNMYVSRETCDDLESLITLLGVCESSIGGISDKIHEAG